MWPFKKRPIVEKRDFSISSPQSILFSLQRAVFNKFTVRKAVSQGYKISPWVYRSISLISRNGSVVPWGVVDPEGSILTDHHLTRVLNNPHPHFSRQDLFELLMAWQLLAGQAYLMKIITSGRTSQLWPISPDRIAPIPSLEPGMLIDGYEEINNQGIKKKSQQFTPENIIHFKLLNPSNPLTGLSPLEACSKAVDIDNEQQDWNKSAMQNRGVPDSLFSFDADLEESQGDAIKEKIKEKFSGSDVARDPLVLGSKGKFTRLSMTPVEMDFSDSRDKNREEIFITYGIPLPAAGVGDFSTFNNMSVSNRMLWESAILPLLDDMKDTFNHTFMDELGDGNSIDYDTSNIAALRTSNSEKIESARTLWNMSIPVETINKLLSLGIEEFDGWDQPFSGTRLLSTQEQRSKYKDMEKSKKKLNEKRNFRDEQDRIDKLSTGMAFEILSKFLSDQKNLIFNAIDNQDDIQLIIDGTNEELNEKLTEVSISIGMDLGDTVLSSFRNITIDETRQTQEELEAEINGFLSREGTILTESSLIQEETSSKILQQVASGRESGATISQLQQSIIDIGIFQPERALRIARTISGTSASIGQLSAGIISGATKKTWHDSGFNVRDQHQARNGETVGIRDLFSDQFGNGRPPRFPLDQNIAAEDRVNCRCSMTLE